MTKPARAQVIEAAGANLLILAASAAGGILMARQLGARRRGEIAVCVVWSAVAHVVSTLGIPNAVGYFAARYPSERPSLVSHAGRIARSQCVTGTVIAAFVLMVVGGRTSTSVATLALFTAWVPLSNLTTYGSSLLQGSARFHALNSLRVISGVGPTALMLLASLAGNGLTTTIVAVCYVTSAAAAAATAWWLAFSRSDSSPEYRRGPELRRYGYANFAGLLSVATNSRVDQMILSLRADAAVLGNYAVASSVAGLVVPMASALSIVGFQRVSAAGGDTARVHGVDRRLIRAVLVVSGTIGMVLFVAVPALVPFVYGHQFEASIPAARILALAGVLLSVNYVSEDVLRGQARPGLVAIAESAGGVLTAVGVLLLASPSLGAVALVTTAGYALTTLVLRVSIARSKR